MSLFRRIFRHPRVVRRYPARFRTTRSQPLSDVLGWFTDQVDPESRAFDTRYGVATRWFDLGNYEPTPPSVIEQVLDGLPAPPQHYSFVDLGSGKGRVVLIAAMRPFRRVVGIERRWLLHRRALRNVEHFTGALCTRPELVCADAARAELPSGPLVLFLYNPFGAGVWDAVLERCRGRELQLISVNPPNPDWLAERGLVRVAHVEHPSDDRRWSRFVWADRRSP